MAEEKKEFRDEVKQDESKTSELRKKFDVNIIKYESENYNNEEGKCLHFTLTDKGTENKYQIYDKSFTVGDCMKIKKDAKYENTPMNKFIDLTMYCLSKENKSHDIKLTFDNGKYVQIDILYAPDQWTSFKFVLTIPAKEMSEVDLLKLRLKEAEDTIKQSQDKIKAAEDKIKELEAITSQQKWKKAVSQYPVATTDKTSYDQNKHLTAITLPQKAGKCFSGFVSWC